MPMPESRTSMRTRACSCRQRSVTPPLGVYLMALDTRFLSIWLTSDGSVRTWSRHGSMVSCSPLLRAMSSNTLRIPSNSSATVTSEISGRRAPDSSLLMSSRAFNNRDIADGVFLLGEDFAGMGVLRHALQGPVQQREGLQRLAQVVAGGREKPAFGLVGADGVLACRNDFLLDEFAIGDVADRGGHQRPAAVPDGTQADLNGNFRAVLAQGVEVKADAHGAHLAVLHVALAMRDMQLAKGLRQQ